MLVPARRTGVCHPLISSEGDRLRASKDPPTAVPTCISQVDPDRKGRSKVFRPGVLEAGKWSSVSNADADQSEKGRGGDAGLQLMAPHQAKKTSATW